MSGAVEEGELDARVVDGVPDLALPGERRWGHDVEARA
jgi:hypothetical protein